MSVFLIFLYRDQTVTFNVCELLSKLHQNKLEREAIVDNIDKIHKAVVNMDSKAIW
jgi:hypothetical protein